MSVLQRELDFSEYDSTNEQLLTYWAPQGAECRVIRSHRRPPRLTKTQRWGALTVVVAALGLAGGPAPTGQPASDAVAAPPAPPADTLAAPIEVTERLEVVELRGGDKASRSRSRGRVRNAVRWVHPLRNVDITSCYGPRWGTTHRGVDYDGETGDKIRAVGSGTVVQAGWRYSGMGYSVVIDHGRWLTIYAHASRILVAVGQRVSAGTKIALVGVTGHVTGSHLHLAVSNGGTLATVWETLINPASWLRARGLALDACG